MTSLREKLRAIRDSDHPASQWARNVVQCMDTLVLTPDDVEVLRALGKAGMMFERKMGEQARRTHPDKQLTSDEIAAIFNLRPHRNDPQ